MPGGRLRSQLLITSRCLGWCGERGSERGSLPLNNLELNWMSHFLNQRTTAGFNSFSARKPAGSPCSRLWLCCFSPACPCPWHGPRVPGVRSSPHQLQSPQATGETLTPSMPSCSHCPKAPRRCRASLQPHHGGWDPHAEGRRGGEMPPQRPRGTSAAIRVFATLFFSLFSAQ